MKYFLMLLMASTLLGSTPGFAQFKTNQQKNERTLEKATQTFYELAQLEESEAIPAALLQQAEGIVIFPGALKVALGVGGQGGRGLAMIRKADGSWSNPYFIGMGEANIGAQIGVQSADLVLLFKNRKHILDLEKGDLTLGGDVGIAAGPMGRNSSASTDIGFEAEIYSYSKSKGLYIGISLEGTVLKTNQKLNNDYYSSAGISMEEVYNDLTTPFHTSIKDLIAAVNHLAKP